MSNLIREDVKLMRSRYDEALELRGIPTRYQYPNLADSDVQGQPIIDSYSDMIDTYIFFEGNPKVKTFKRYGWVVENSQDLPFLIHCSFNLPYMQKDSLFRISGQYSEIPDRIFRVTELTYDLQAPDHIVAQVVPVYDEKTLVGRTRTEIANTFNKSNTFLKPRNDYRGEYHNTREDGVKFRKD